MIRCCLVLGAGPGLRSGAAERCFVRRRPPAGLAHLGYGAQQAGRTCRPHAGALGRGVEPRVGRAAARGHGLEVVEPGRVKLKALVDLGRHGAPCKGGGSARPSACLAIVEGSERRQALGARVHAQRRWARALLQRCRPVAPASGRIHLVNAIQAPRTLPSRRCCGVQVLNASAAPRHPGRDEKDSMFDTKRSYGDNAYG